MSDDKKKDEEKLPLKLKFMAWWEGYDADEIAERLHKYNAEKGEPEPQSKPEDSQTDEDADDEDAPGEESWSGTRAEISQFIWGQGFCGPGGPSYVISLAQSLTLSKDMTLLQLGARLGGTARVLTEKFGTFVSGFDQSHTLVEEGNKLSEASGLGKKVQLYPYNPEREVKFERKYDRALCRDELLHIRSKQALVQQVFDSLKDDGVFVITEYMLADDSMASRDDYQAWREREPLKPHPITAAATKQMMKDCGFNVRVVEDITKRYMSLISESWEGADKVAANLVKQKDGIQLVDALMREAEIWTTRANLMRQGVLQVYRLAGTKPGKEIR